MVINRRGTSRTRYGSYQLQPTHRVVVVSVAVMPRLLNPRSPPVVCHRRIFDDLEHPGAAARPPAPLQHGHIAAMLRLGFCLVAAALIAGAAAVGKSTSSPASRVHRLVCTTDITGLSYLLYMCISLPATTSAPQSTLARMAPLSASAAAASARTMAVPHAMMAVLRA